MLPEELEKSFLRHIPACHLENASDKLFVGGIEFIPVQFKKDKRSHRACTLIPIHKSVI